MSNQFSFDNLISMLTNPEMQQQLGSAAVPFVQNLFGQQSEQSKPKPQSEQPTMKYPTSPFSFVKPSTSEPKQNDQTQKFPFLYQRPANATNYKQEYQKPKESSFKNMQMPFNNSYLGTEQKHDDLLDCNDGCFHQGNFSTEPKKTLKRKFEKVKRNPQTNEPLPTLVRRNVSDDSIMMKSPVMIKSRELVVETVSDGVSAVSTLVGTSRPNKGEGNVIFLDKLTLTIPEGTVFENQSTKTVYTYGKSKEQTVKASDIAEIDMDDTVCDLDGTVTNSSSSSSSLPIMVKANTLWKGKDDKYGMLYRTQVDQEFYIERGVSVVFPANVVFYHGDTPMTFNKSTIVTLC